MKHKIKKILAIMLIVTVCFTCMPMTAFAGVTSTYDLSLTGDADSEVGVVVSVGKSKVTVSINQVGTSGTAQLVRLEPNEYFKGDTMSGLSKDVNKAGDVVGEYTCGTQATIEFNRYNNDGTDNLYNKYYLVQNNKILVGPVYASEVDSLRTVEDFEATTKKGLTLEDETTIDMAKEMGVSNTVINMDLCTLIYANEDKDGNKIDNTKKNGVIEFESQGETFYFDANYVKAQDSLISAYSKEGMNVTLILISWAKTWTSSYPSSLMYLEKANMNRQTMAFNTSSERGQKYFIAAMEFMADRYSKSSSIGLVNKFVVGNEIDYTYDWSLIEPLMSSNTEYNRTDFNVFMEEYARGLRIANNAVKKYNSEAKVAVSLTHNWAESCLTSYGYGKNDKKQIRYNSYAPKEICDWLVQVDGARGNYDWGLAVHPYPIGTSSSKPTVTDANRTDAAKPITGDWEKSPWITAANLELYQLYLDQVQNKCNGETREVYITETSICNLDGNKSSVSAEAYATSLYEQAASIAQYYYRAAHIDCIKEIAYFQPHDQAANKLGLMTDSGTKKPSYDVWKYVDTELSFSYANKYLKYLGKTTWLDVMKCVKSDFNWDTIWDEDNIIVRELNSAKVERSLNLENGKTTYGADESINVIATGNEGDIVGLYKVGDDTTKVDPIYSYPVVGKDGNVVFRSGKAYNILAYGDASALRVNDAKLTAGDYKVVLTYGDTGEKIEKTIKLTANYSYGKTAYSIKSDKNTYKAGEDIIVTATGNTGCWAGLYKKSDKYGTGNTTSIYWYYVNDEKAGQVSGKPTIIQSTKHNTDSSNPGSKVAPGEYIIYLFDESSGNSYNEVDSIEITIEPGVVENLTSIEYKLENNTDGFANGVVTIKKPDTAYGTTDCLMYWADAEGKPLDGYTSLAKFKLEDERTVYQMPSHTIIPEGAKKLIAYGFDGDTTSEKYVSCDLPENCGYDITGANAEFQIVSDVHVTTDKGATGEVKLANKHFTMMLEDIQKNSPSSLGIFINGDIANTGSEAEYKKVYNLYNESLAKGRLPEIHMSIGNHDWMMGNPRGQFQKYAKIFNSNLKEQPDNVYYAENVGGYDFIYLGGEQAGLYAVLSAEQLAWFDATMAKITAEDPEKPVFVLLHQGLYNTVAGTLTGQGWDGVSNETALKKVLSKYGQIIIVGGHSHWELNSEAGIYAGDEEMAVAFNTASVGYLWSSYDVRGGEFVDGSHGYYVRVYDDKVVFIGRDFENNLFIPSATFVVQPNIIETEADAYTISVDGEALNLEAKSLNGSEVTYESTNTAIASVTADGTVIAKREGEVQIIITALGDNKTVVDRKYVTVRIGDASAYRIYGDNRYETSFETADALKEQLGVEKFDSIVVADGSKFADALSGSYLANKLNAPIIMVDQNNVTTTRTYIGNNLADGGTVYLLGGTNAVPDELVNGLTGCTVKRLAGDTRYETNLAILKEAGVAGGEIIVCTGNNFADGLSASAVNLPILLVGDEMLDVQKEFLGGLGENSVTKFHVIGGENAISKTVEADLETYAGVERIGGADRYATSRLIADKFFQVADNAVIAYAMNFPDGLCAGPLAMNMSAPLLLTSDDSDAQAAEYCKEKGIRKGYVLGGRILVSDDTVKKILDLEVPPVKF